MAHPTVRSHDAAHHHTPALVFRASKQRRALYEEPSAAPHSAMCSSGSDPFDRLCDDLMLLTLKLLASRAQSPADLIALTLTCRRFRTLGTHATVLKSLSKQAMQVRASSWGPSVQHFLTRCAAVGNIEAAFTLGMIQFYCTGERNQGIKQLVMAAKAGHGDALFSLGILQLNGSGGEKRRQARAAGVALCARAAMVGSMEAAREVGHCIKNGAGVARNVNEGKRMLQEVNKREAMLFLRDELKRLRGGGVRPAPPVGGAAVRQDVYKVILRRCLASDCGLPVPLGWLMACWHPVHRFLVDWRALKGQQRPSADDRPPVLRHCHNEVCGRSETRPREFQQCAGCCSASYCSRSCQSLDWKLRHLFQCCPAMPSLIY